MYVCLRGGGGGGAGNLLPCCCICLLLLLGLRSIIALTMVFSEQLRDGRSSSGSQGFLSPAICVCDQAKGIALLGLLLSGVGGD